MSDKIKEVTEVVSDNALSDTKITVSVSEIFALASQMSNQQNTAASAVKDVMKDFTSVVKSDTDVNGEEVMKSSNSIGAAAIVASLAAKIVDTNLQSTVAAWTAITQMGQLGVNLLSTAQVVNSATANAYNAHVTAMQKEIDTLLVQPYPYAENAPASQDTGGEGDDTGDTGTEDKKKAATAG